MDRGTDRKTDRWKYGHSDRQTNGQMDRRITERQTKSQADEQPDKQKDRQTGMQAFCTEKWKKRRKSGQSTQITLQIKQKKSQNMQTKFPNVNIFCLNMASLSAANTTNAVT